jgi:hypothetical protein
VTSIDSNEEHQITMEKLYNMHMSSNLCRIAVTELSRSGPTAWRWVRVSEGPKTSTALSKLLPDIKKGLKASYSALFV